MGTRGALSGTANPGTVAPSSGWALAGVSDFDGDGNMDLLWYQSTTGYYAIWYLDNKGNYSASMVFQLATNSGWWVAGIGDLDGDGHADLVWYQAGTGNTGAWYFGARGVISGASGLSTVPPSTGYLIAGVADFDGDGHSDLLWYQTTTGNVSVWYSGGRGQIANASSIGNVPITSGWTLMPPEISTVTVMPICCGTKRAPEIWPSGT